MKRIIAIFPELLGVGGVQEASRLTAQAVSRIALQYGWGLDLVSLNDSRDARRLVSSDQYLGFRAFGRQKTHFMAALMLAARRDARIVIAAHPYLAIPALWMKRIAQRAKIIVISHGVEVWNPLSSGRRRALLRSDLVLAPSRFTLEKLAEVQSVPREKLRRLPWPLDSLFLEMAAKELGALPPPKSFPRGRVILTVGRWAASERYKGLDDLIHATATLRQSLPDLHLVAVGSGDDLPRLRHLAADLGSSDRVHFFQGLSREEIGACYAHADVFALPSTGEGFGIVFLEAMAFAKPIVAAAAGGTIDIVEHDVNGLLVPPGNASELKQALTTLLLDSSLCERLGACGAETVRSRYGFDTFQDELEDALEHCGLE